MEAAMAKWYASVVAQKAAGSAIEWAGGVGFTRETGIEKFWRDSKIVSVLKRPMFTVIVIHSRNLLSFREPSTRARRTFNCRRSPSSFRNNIHNYLFLHFECYRSRVELGQSLALSCMIVSAVYRCVSASGREWAD